MSEPLRLQRAALADFGLFAFRCNDIDTLLRRAVELVSDTLDVPLVKVLEHLPERGEMLIRSGVNWHEGVVGHETFGDDERSPGGYALRAEHPVISPDIDVEDRFEMPDVLRRHGVKSMINVIIVAEGAAFGVLEVDAQEPRDFGDDDVAFLRSYANLLAAAIERIRTHRELERLAHEQGILARELGHRVKNLFGVVRALASHTATRDQTSEQFRDAFIGRLHALSAAESLVFESVEGRADLLTLAEQVLAPYRGDGSARITIKGAPVELPARRARMFGLALYELATNAVKYGALDATDGMVRVEWRVEDADGGRKRVTMTWEEADGPAVVPPQRKGFGTQLLEDVVAHELNGEADLVYGARGLRYRLAFPVDERRS